MTANESDEIVFDNLIEAGTSDIKSLGQKIRAATATPFTNGNAVGVIKPMTLAEVEARAAAFGRRAHAMRAATQ